LPQAWLAAKAVSQRCGLEIAVINLPWLARVDTDWLRRAVSDRHAVFTLDNHLIAGAQGRMIAAAIAELDFDHPPRVQRFGLSDFPLCGQNDEVLRAHALDAESLAHAFALALAN
jgi:transketolase